MKSDHSSSMKTAVLLTIALWAGSAMVPTESFSLLPTTTIHVINGLKPGSAAFSFHCQSGDNDLGFQQRGVGQEFEWTFSNNVWGTTLFHCDFWWNYKQIKAIVYEDRREFSTKQIYYKATEGGIYKSYDQIKWIPIFPWGWGNSDPSS